MFSKACEYGIKATLHIAYQSQMGQRVGLKDIAKAIDSPEAFTAKILQQLSKHRIIESVKGPNGGFEIAEDKRDNLRLSLVVIAIDGDEIFTGCVLGITLCNEDKPCPVHDKFKAIRKDIISMLDNTTAQELADKLNSGVAFLKR